MKLTMLVGLPGAGKSTKAKEMVRATGNAGRINRDALRAMLFDSWSGKRESVVVDCEKAIAGVLFKLKNFRFLEAESKLLDKGEADIETAQTEEEVL